MKEIDDDALVASQFNKIESCRVDSEHSYPVSKKSLMELIAMILNDV